LLLALSLIVVYFTPVSLILQICILFIAVSMSVMIYKKENRVNSDSAKYILIVLLILSLITIIHVLKLFNSNLLLINIVILLNLLTWFYLGLQKKFKLLYFISGLALLLMVLLYLFRFNFHLFL